MFFSHFFTKQSCRLNVVLACWPSNKPLSSMTCEEFRVAASDFHVEKYSKKYQALLVSLNILKHKCPKIENVAKGLCAVC